MVKWGKIGQNFRNLGRSEWLGIRGLDFTEFVGVGGILKSKKLKIQTLCS
jgi:hypothetical protein